MIGLTIVPSITFSVDKFSQHDAVVRMDIDDDIVVMDLDSDFTCDICVDEKPTFVFFRVVGCNHIYCFDCISKYVASKLEDNIKIISCPYDRCQVKLKPENCRSFLPQKVFERWGDGFYCPYQDCSSFLGGGDAACATREALSVCPGCRRLVCAQCKVAWHSDVSCEEYQKLNKDEREREADILLMKLAQSLSWKRCPNCKAYVEKNGGCHNMRCRCGTHFNYKTTGEYGNLFDTDGYGYFNLFDTDEDDEYFD